MNFTHTHLLENSMEMIMKVLIDFFILCQLMFKFSPHVEFFANELFSIFILYDTCFNDFLSNWNKLVVILRHTHWTISPTHINFIAWNIKWSLHPWMEILVPCNIILMCLFVKKHFQRAPTLTLCLS